MSGLDDDLTRAHAAGNAAALVGLYAEAAGMVTAPADAFFLTQAWVFALEAGDPRAAELEVRLRERGAA